MIGLAVRVLVSLSLMSIGWPSSVSPPAAAGQLTKALATAEAVPGQARVAVLVTNNAKVPLEAWQMRVTYRAGAKVASVDISSDTYLGLSADRSDPSLGPIAAGATRREIFAVSFTPESAHVEMLSALFSDLTTEGNESIQEVLARRESHAKALGFYLAAMQQAEGRSPQEAKGAVGKALLDHAAELGPLVRRDATVKAMQESIDEWLAVSDSQTFGRRLSELRRLFQQQHQLALRHRKGKL